MSVQHSEIFLRAKLDLLAAAILATGSRSATDVLRYYGDQIGRAANRSPRGLTEFKRIDRALDQVGNVALGLSGLKVIRTRLQTQFGEARLGDDMESVVKRVTARGRIRTIAEADSISHILTNLANLERLGRERWRELERLLADYQPLRRKKKG